MAIATMDDLISVLPGQRKCFNKRFVHSGSSWSYRLSSWTADGFPGPGAAPGSTAGVVPTKATAGAIVFTNPTAGKLSYLAQLMAVLASNSSVGNLHLYDRLVHSDGLSGTVSTAQTIGTPAITRPNANGDNVELFIEIYTALGGIGQSPTVSYTNQAGTAGRSGSTGTFATNSTAARALVAVKLQSGDTGVRSVQSLTLGGSTGAAGNFGVTLARRIGSLAIPATPGGALSDALDLGLPQIYDDACLFWIFEGATSATSNVTGQLTMVQN